MEGDVASIADRPSSNDTTNASADHIKKEQEKWDAWKANGGISRTEAKRRYVEKLIETMHKYASTTPEARELVEELEFVWDQIKNNSQHPSSGSEHSSPLQTLERSGYIQNGSSGAVASSTAAFDGAVGNGGQEPMRVMSPISQVDEDGLLVEEEEREEFVDAPVSQIDEEDFHARSDAAVDEEENVDAGVQAAEPRRALPSRSDARWRRRIESSLMKLTTQVTALQETLDSRHFRGEQRSFFGWILRLSWWAVQLVVADAVLLWIVILYMRRKDDRRLELAVRVLLGDAVAQVQKVGREVRMPSLGRVAGRKLQS